MFVEKARKVHGDKYDYSKVEYVNSKTKVEIICPKHGSFVQSPDNHIYNKQGCPRCKAESTGKRLLDTTESFIQKATLVHGSRYDYSETEYVNTTEKVRILCKKHGPFYQQPGNHINMKNGCTKCRDEDTTAKTVDTKESFIGKATKVHGDKFDYSKVEYVRSKCKVEIICRKHGSFWQMPANHLNIQAGCPFCRSSVSKVCTSWLNSLGIPINRREIRITISNYLYIVDALDTDSNTIYEYFGYFWHGHPSHTDHTKINPKSKKPFKYLFEKTLERIKTFQDAGYNLVYVWGP